MCFSEVTARGRLPGYVKPSCAGVQTTGRKKFTIANFFLDLPKFYFHTT
jgi:hypothetical protein